MATKAKEDAYQAKEKRGTSPSFPPRTDPAERKSPNRLGPNQKTNVAEKRVMNCLKPTISSSQDTSKHQVKKPNDPTGPNPSLTRRRSFDKPPSPSQVPKPLNSNERNIRSHSFSSKMTPSSKPLLEKSIKQSSLQSRSAAVKKTSTTPITKTGDTSRKKTLHVSPPPKVDDTEQGSRPEHMEFSTADTKVELVNEEGSYKTADIWSLDEGKESVGSLHNEVSIEDGTGLKICESSSTSQEVTVPPSVYLGERNDEHIPVQDDDGAAEEFNKGEENAFAVEPIEEGGEAKQGKVTGENPAIIECKEINEDEVLEPKETQEPKMVVAKGFKFENTVKKSPAAVTPGKKEAYNDVIEETAIKFREQRKNKVKALVGAFETVISLESEATPE